MNYSEAELHEKAWEAFKALLANGDVYAFIADDKLPATAYDLALAFLAERERRGWTGANGNPVVEGEQGA